MERGETFRCFVGCFTGSHLELGAHHAFTLALGTRTMVRRFAHRSLLEEVPGVYAGGETTRELQLNLFSGCVTMTSFAHVPLPGKVTIGGENTTLGSQIVYLRSADWLTRMGVFAADNGLPILGSIARVPVHPREFVFSRPSHQLDASLPTLYDMS